MKRFKTLIKEAALAVPDKDETMGIPRREMPQIDSKNHAHFFNHLKKNNISATKRTVDPSKLKATQGHFNKEKIRSMMDGIQAGKIDNKPIIISKDNYVMDGHHRWLAHSNLNKDIDVHQVNVKAKKLLDMMHEYPKSYTEKLYESIEYFVEADETCMIITPAHMKAFEQFVDKMFEKYKIDFDFTKHFRERISDTRNNPCINMKEIADMIKKIYSKYAKGEKSLSKYIDSEAVIKDMQSDLNMPIAVEYNRKNDEIEVVAKTIMRKKNFRTPNPEIKV
jgi:hypothetical protein